MKLKYYKPGPGVYARGNPDGKTLEGKINEVVHLMVPGRVRGVNEPHALCHNGAYHIWYTEEAESVTCPECIAAGFDSSSYDTEAIKIDAQNGNFSPDHAEEYWHENIVRESLINGQFKQAREQCARFGISYEVERERFRGAGF